MSFQTSHQHTTVARGSMQRATVELANAIAVYALSRVLTAAGAAKGTTESKIKTAATATYLIGGALKSKSATDDLWTLSGTAVPASSWQKYLLMLDGSGTASIQEGTISSVSAAAVGWSNISAVSPWAPFLTAVGSTKAIISVLTIATDSSHTFTPGTTEVDATGITATLSDGIDQSILPLIANETGLIVGIGG